MLGGQRYGFSLVRREGHLLASEQLAVTGKRRHAVALEEADNAAGELRNDRVLASDHAWHVRGHLAHVDAEFGEAVLGVRVAVGGVKQRFGGYATPVQAGAAQRRFAVLAHRLVDAGGLHAELGAANGGSVPRRPGADDDEVVLVHLFPQ